MDPWRSIITDTLSEGTKARLSCHQRVLLDLIPGLCNFTMLLLAVLLLFTFFLIYIVVHNRTSLRYPPGPKSLPFLGSLKDLPKDKETLVFTEWSRKYGQP